MSGNDIGVASAAARVVFEVRGIVQGVGFRPFVFGLADELGLNGEVGNHSAGVSILVEGPHAAVAEFASRLRTDAPPLSRIDSLVEASVGGSAPFDAVRKPVSQQEPPAGFSIVHSRVDDGDRTLVSPDAAPCAECLSEMSDPTNRRFGHAFISCTNCGPRFSIITGLPYDRESTTMAKFQMCRECEVEYRDPRNRRYHAQPIACHHCGPQLSFGSGAYEDKTVDAIDAAVAALRRGAIVAVKAIGGYQLLCDATNAEVIRELRRRKSRPDKPFAVMVTDCEQADLHVVQSESEQGELSSLAAPIVLSQKTKDSGLPDLIAPGSPLLGVMLPSSPIYHMLSSRFGHPLVVTSANRPGEPLTVSSEGVGKLDHLYDYVLDNDREIHTPVDDSVVRLVGSSMVPLRRARGYAPIPVQFARGHRAVIAAGGELKNTCCVCDGRQAWVSQHVGDMENLATLNRFEGLVSQFQEMYDVTPNAIAVDAHPGYISSKWARRTVDLPVVEVQHHHAHVAAVMAEHDLDPHIPVLGFAFDGTGYGTDGTVWGGEVLLATATGFDRVGHLRPIHSPGGDAAVKRPSLVALAHLHEAGIEWEECLPPILDLTRKEAELLRQQLDRSIACVLTTSMGRLFDAVASLIGLRHRVSYEAQAAIELEALAEAAPKGLIPYRFELSGRVIDQSPVVGAVVGDVLNGRAGSEIAWCFHAAVADAVQETAELVPKGSFDAVVLSGGVFQNGLLHRMCLERLGNRFDVRTHQLVPPNDGGLALGQAFIATHLSDEQIISAN